jgi:hypothetical protein
LSFPVIEWAFELISGQHDEHALRYQCADPGPGTIGDRIDEAQHGAALVAGLRPALS